MTRLKMAAVWIPAADCLLSIIGISLTTLQVSSVHEVGRPPAQVRLFGFLEGKLDSRQTDQEDVEAMEEEDEEEEPKGSVVALAVHLKDEIHLIEVGNPIGQMMKFHFGRKQDHHQTAAETCRTQDFTVKHFNKVL